MRLEWSRDRGALSVHAPAKVNVYLEILGERPDGFHEIDTLMQAVSIEDELTFREGGPDSGGADRLRIETPTGRPGPPASPENLVLRALSLVREEVVSRGGQAPGALDVTLSKRIPMGAGLGGGSADAAATLLAAREFWGLDLESETLERLSARLGSDVAFFLTGGLARCTGRGEIITPVPAQHPGETFHYVLVSPDLEISTALIYKELKAMRGRGKALTRSGGLNNMSHNSIWEELIRTSSRASSEVRSVPPAPLRADPATSEPSPESSEETAGERLGADPGSSRAPGCPAGSPGRPELYFNRLQEVAFELFPQLETLHEDMLAEGFSRVLLTGSGSTLFGRCASREEAKDRAAQLSRRASGLWASARVETVQSLPPWA